MFLQFSSRITSADAETRTLTGQVVPFGKVGNTNLGPVIFETGSITDLQPGIVLNMEHDRTRPVGKAISFEANPAGIVGKFKIASTTTGNDLLVEAADGIRTGFSIEADIANHEVVDGVIRVKQATLVGVAAVTSPAFGENAQITQVAASEPDETEAQISSTPVADTTQKEEDTMSESTAVAVETTDTVVTAAAPSYVTQKLRNPITNPGSFLEHSVRAALGNEDSALYVKAASDTTTTEVAGLVPTPQLATIWDPKSFGDRPAIAAVRTATLPASGMTFEIPRVKTLPTVAATAEKGAFSDTQAEIEYVSCTVSKYAGMQTFDVEVLDRTSPAFFEELTRLMAAQYNAATDLAVWNALAAGTLDSTIITLPWDGDEIAGFIGRAAASIFAGTRRFPTGIVMTPDQWAALLAVNDSNKRPLLAAGDPQNSMGNLSAGSPVGSIMGLPVYVSASASGTGDDSVIVVNRDAFVWYEGAGPLQLRTNVVSTGKVQVGYYGYGSAVTLTAAGAFTLNQAV